MSKRSVIKEVASGIGVAEQSMTRPTSEPERKPRQRRGRRAREAPSSRAEPAQQEPGSRGFLEPELVDRAPAPNGAQPVGFLEPSSE